MASRQMRLKWESNQECYDVFLWNMNFIVLLFQFVFQLWYSLRVEEEPNQYLSIESNKVGHVK